MDNSLGQDDAVGLETLKSFEIMAHHKNDTLGVAHEGGHDLDKLVDARTVEPAGGLIEHEEFWMIHKSASQKRPLLLATRKLAN